MLKVNGQYRWKILTKILKEINVGVVQGLFAPVLIK